MSLLTLGILGVVFIIIFCIGFVIEHDDWRIAFFTVGVIGIVAVGGGGFGAHASSNYKYMIVEKIEPTTIVKTDSRIIVEFYVDDEITKLESERIIDYTTITDSTVFYLVRYYNYYGYEQRYSNNKDKYFITYNKTFKSVDFGKKVEPIEIEID
jgi:MFS family permease